MLSQCPSCKKQIEVPDSAIGKKVRCTGCQAVFVVAAPPRKKTTDAPKSPAPPPATLDMLEELPGEIDALEEIADEPAAPTLDFAPQVTTISGGTRYRARYSAALMTTAALVTLVLSLGLIGWGGFVYYQTKEPTLLGGACCVGSVLSLSVIAILIGARWLGQLRSRVMGITAAALSFVNVLGGLAGLVMMMFEMLRAFERWQPFIAVVCVFQMALCLWAAISGGLVAMRAEVIAAIAETRKRV